MEVCFGTEFVDDNVRILGPAFGQTLVYELRCLNTMTRSIIYSIAPIGRALDEAEKRPDTKTITCPALFAPPCSLTINR